MSIQSSLRICGALALFGVLALTLVRGAAAPIDFTDPSSKIVVGNAPVRSLPDKVATSKIVARVTILEVTPPSKASLSADPVERMMAKDFGLEAAICRARVDEVFKGSKKLSEVTFRLGPIWSRHDLDHLAGESFIAFLHVPPGATRGEYWLLGGRDEGLFSTRAKTFEEWSEDGRRIFGEKYDYTQYVAAIRRAAAVN